MRQLDRGRESRASVSENVKTELEKNSEAHFRLKVRLAWVRGCRERALLDQESACTKAPCGKRTEPLRDDREAGTEGSVTGGEERVKEQTVRALPAIVKESVFHPKSCGKICPSLPPLCICPRHPSTKELAEGSQLRANLSNTFDERVTCQ